MVVVYAYGSSDGWYGSVTVVMDGGGGGIVV